MTEREQLNPAWWPRFWRSPAALALCALLAVAFWWTWHWMAIRWDEVNSYYSHGWLIPPIVVVLLYRKRKQFAAARLRPSRWGLAILLPSLVLHLLGTAWQVGFLSGFAMIGVLAGLVAALCGAEVLRLALFPLLFLAFMVPLPVLMVESVSFRLKLLAARLAVGVLDVVGLPAVREGSYIRIPTGTVVVDDVCSGLKYLISLTAFGALYAHISSVRQAQKAVLFLASVPISLAANVLRVALMVGIGYFWGIPATEKWYLHDTFGFVLFAVAFVMLFATESLFLKRPWRGKKDQAAQAPPAAARRAVAVPTARQAASYGRMYGISLASLAVVAALSVFLAWPRSTEGAADVLARFPLALGPWQGRDYQLDARTYAILGTHDVLSRVYADPEGRGVQLVVVLARQTRKRTHPPEQCYTGEGYTIRRSEVRSVTLPAEGGSRPLEVRELVLARHDQDRVVWYFFKSGDDLTTSYLRHQARLALSKLTRPDAADVLVRLDAAAPKGDLDSARQMLSGFLSHALPDLTGGLP